MKTIRTATVDMSEIVRMLRAELGITAHEHSISCEVVRSADQREQDKIVLTWSEGDTLEHWER